MSIELTASLISVGSFVVSMLVIVWRFATITTEFRSAIDYMKKQLDKVEQDRATLGQIPLVVQRMEHMERLVSGYPQAVQNIALLQAQVTNQGTSLRAMKAVREPYRSHPEIDDDDKG